MISAQNVGALIASFSILMVNSVAGQTVESRKLMGTTINEESNWSPYGKTIAFDSIGSGKLNIPSWRIETRDELFSSLNSVWC